MENKITKEQAQKEVESWLDTKKISPRKREANQDSIDAIVEAMMDGVLSLRDDKVFVHELKFDTGGEKPIKQLEYSPRLRVSTVQACLQGVSATDVDGRFTAYIAALTGKATGIIKALDTEDYSIARSISVFFI